MKKIIYSPSKYIQGAGELSNLSKYAALLGEKGVYAVVDSIVLKQYARQLEESFWQNNLELKTDKFNGECSQNEIDRILKEVQEKGYDVVAGIGGGKTLDTAKAVAHHANIPVLIAPTVASSDAPCSALAVIYTPDGKFERYLYLRNNPNIVLVDTEIISKAPPRLLLSGIGDALSTYFEARACYQSNAKSIAGGACSGSALALAEACLNILMEEGVKAKYAIESQTNSKSLELIIEANTYLSGIGFESGGLAAAHAIHNGMTALKETHEMFHGEKVAFGTIAQLVLENAPLEEIRLIIDFCRDIGLPTNLTALGVKEVTPEKIRRIAEAACAEGETIYNMPFEISVDSVVSAISVAHKMGS